MTQPAESLLPEIFLTYIKLGIPLIPIRKGTKVPACLHGAKDASCDPVQILNWMAEFPDCNWAIVAGHQMRDGRWLALVDIDTYKGVEYRDLNLPSGPSELTPRKGYHLPFGAREPTGSNPAVLGREGLELRCHNEYTVCEPSENEHGKYQWELGYTLDDLAIPDLPEFFYGSKIVERPDNIEDDDPINTVLGAAFEIMGWLGPSVPGKRYVICPWGNEHSGGKEFSSSTVLLPATTTSKFGAFSCRHAHCGKRSSMEAFRMCSPEAQEQAKAKFPVLKVVEYTDDPVMSDYQPTSRSSKEYISKKNLVGKFAKSGDFVCSKVIANVITLCSQGPWEDKIKYDEMAETTMLMSKGPHETETSKLGYPRCWTDNDDSLTASWLQKSTYAFEASSALVKEGMDVIAKESKYNRLLDYLKGIKWDGTPRLDTWLTDYLGAGDSGYVRACGRMWMISAIARAFNPGCQVDYVLVLEGPQRSGKSSAFRILGGEWFTDDIGDISTKDAPERMRGNWIIEIPEMAGILVRETSVVKAFITRLLDNYREAYGRRAGKFKRRCIFCGTVNEAQYLRDHTGGGRYWCVLTCNPDLNKLARDRDQLWAEAVQAYQAGEAWWPTTKEFREQAAKEAEARRAGDPWEDLLRVRLEGLNEITALEAFETLGIPAAQRDDKQQARIGRCLQVLGFKSGDGKWSK